MSSQQADDHRLALRLTVAPRPLDLPQLRLLASTGSLRAGSAVAVQNGWLFHLQARSGDSWQPVALARDRGGLRYFASLDTLAHQAERLGLTEVKVIFGGDNDE